MTVVRKDFTPATLSVLLLIGIIALAVARHVRLLGACKSGVLVGINE